MKDLATYLLFRIASGVVGVIPERLAVAVGTRIGWIVWRWADRRKTMAIRHMTRVLGEASAESAARGMFAAYGRYWGEVLWMRPRRTEQTLRRVRVDGLHRVTAARDAGAGMIFALPHIGNWEVAGLIAQNENIELLAVAEKLSNRRMAEWFIGLRKMLGIDVVLADGSRDVIRKLIEVLGRGGAVALVTDRDLSRNGTAVDFFGEETTLPSGAVSLALSTGAPLFPVAAYFDHPIGHHVVVEPALVFPSEGSREDRLAAGIKGLAEALEDLVRKQPEQWHLVQPNWPSDRRQR